MLHDRITVVMITRNRAGDIRTALQHLVELLERPRIIVVDNGSTDQTVNIARNFGRTVEVIPLGEDSGGAGRNVGVKMARTPYVAFSDDDSWWAPGALPRAAERFDSFPHLGLRRPHARRSTTGPQSDIADHGDRSSPARRSGRCKRRRTAHCQFRGLRRNRSRQCIPRGGRFRSAFRRWR